MTFQKRMLRMHPANLVLASFLLVIALGTILLKLPMSTTGGAISWMDALFTATSAVCVTGLAVVDTGTYYTRFGHWVILALIQVGGLGLMTISVALFQWMGRSVSFRQRMAMQDVFAHTPREDIFGLVRNIMLFTFGTEAVGAVFLAFRWSQDSPLSEALFSGIFHSISAFCNAGFGLLPDSLMGYAGDTLVNLTVCGLIVIGGIGFPVLHDLRKWFAGRGEKRVRLSVQTKTVLLTTALLIVSGAVIFGILERHAAWASASPSHQVLVPLFQSITCRTAGFNTVDITSLGEATLTMMIVLMFFGASPGSCGGGVKTTTLALLTAFLVSRIRRHRRVNLFRKSVPAATVSRSMSLMLLSIAIVVVVVFLILMESEGTGSDPRTSFLAHLFETVSAFGTVGLSMGLTPLMGNWGKFWIILTMIVGRVGVLTFSYIIVGAGAANGVEYAEENLMIG